MYALYFVVENAIFLFAAWTLGYHLCLWARWPAITVFIPAAFIYVLLCLWLGRSPRKVFASVRRNAPFIVGAACFGLVMAVFTLVVFRPDADDVSYFHRALVQLDDLGAPFVLEHTQHNVSGLPPISIMHVMTSYEPLAAILGRFLVGNPLWFYQNVGGAVAAFLVPIVYVLLFRRLRFSSPLALWGAVLVAVFLVLDGGTHRAFGNFSFVRLWQGKAIAVTVLVPLILLFCMRFLTRPTRRRLAVVGLSTVCAVGLSGSSLFLVPVLVFASSLAYAATFLCSRGRLVRAAVLNAGSLYCLAIAAAFLLGVLPRPANTQLWEVWSENVWWKNLSLVLGNLRLVARDAVILLVVPAATLGPFHRRYVVLLSLSLAAVFANPVTGPEIIDLVTPSAFWRFAYLFPLPLCFGVAIKGLWSNRLSTVGLIRIFVTGLAVIAVCWSFGASIFSRACVKSPWADKLPARESAFCRAASDDIAAHAAVLAPADVVWVMALLRPDLRFETCRPEETIHVFRCAGKPLEGKDRILAQRVVTKGPGSSKDEDAFLRCMAHNVDYLVIANPCLDVVRKLLHGKGHDADALVSVEGYTLLRITLGAE